MAAFDFAVLGSGSGGNASVLQTSEGLFLIDAGLSLRQTQRRLASLGLRMDELQGVFITHFDQDHFRPVWTGHLRRTGLPLYVARPHCSIAQRVGLPEAQVRPLPLGETIRVGSLRVRTTLVAHDSAGSAAFVFEHLRRRLGYATDLGHVPTELLDAFSGLDALAIESNYDRSMQLKSDRPEFLKERIMGGNGHLSNCEAFAAVHTIARSSELQHVALLHLSSQCNDPSCIRDLWMNQAMDLGRRLVLSSQDEPTKLLRIIQREPGIAISSKAMSGTYDLLDNVDSGPH